MPSRLRTQLRRAWLIPFLLVSLLGVPATVHAVTPAQCAGRANDTPSKLVECVTKKDLMAHLQEFQDIANANPGADGHPSRNSGEPGYKASVDYVVKVMQDAGYDVTVQTYQFEYYAYTGIPSFSETSPTAHTYELGVEWYPGQTLGTITNLQLDLAGGIVIPPTQTASSASGCQTSDFPDSVKGHAVLIQRGSCNFGVKVLNAQSKGATGVVIFNEGNPGPPNRTGLIVGSMLDANDNPFIPTIPVAFTTFAVGEALYNQVKNGQAPKVSLSVPAITKPNTDDYNVIAESRGGDKNHVLVADAHLDAIYGAGILDNATGSAAILDIAQQMKNVTPTNKLRFIWFGGEELGLLGSEYYVTHLTSTQGSHIGYDLDADVFGTPNYIIGILDPAAPDFFSRTVPETFPNRVYKPSTVSRDQSVAFFDQAGYNHEFLSPNGTDAIWFNRVGIPASGLLTGQDCCKTPEEVALFGGQLGNYEGNLGTTDGGCVDNPFRWCDNIDNVDPNNFTLVSKAFANTVVRMAFDTKIMSSSSDFNSKAPKDKASTSRRFVAK
jgi:Zn-dependent M28 family amino/carboxypeptidase